MKTVTDVATMFGVHYQTVRNWINKGDLEAFKVGNTIRISDEAIKNMEERFKK